MAAKCYNSLNTNFRPPPFMPLNFLVSEPCGGVDDVDGKDSEATISDVFGQKDFIRIEYIIDPKGYFHIKSEGKDRDVLVGHYKHQLRRDIPSSIDLRSATLEEFPVKLKVVFQNQQKHEEINCQRIST